MIECDQKNENEGDKHMCILVKANMVSALLTQITITVLLAMGSSIYMYVYPGTCEMQWFMEKSKLLFYDMW